MSFAATAQESAASRRALYLAEVHAEAKEKFLDAITSGDIGRVMIPAKIMRLASGRATTQSEQRAGDVLIDGTTATHAQQDALSTFLSACLKSTDETVRLQAQLMVSIAAERFADDQEVFAEARDFE